jgi:hypothetical protein
MVDRTLYDPRFHAPVRVSTRRKPRVNRKVQRVFDPDAPFQSPPTWTYHWFARPA